MAQLQIEDPKSLREILCRAQSAEGERIRKGLVIPFDDTKTDVAILQRLIDQIDILRPLGPNGKHGRRHTDECGCEDK